MLGAIKCGADEKISQLPNDYNAALMKIKSQFAEDAKHRRAELEHTVSLTHGQRYVLRELVQQIMRDVYSKYPLPPGY